MSHRFSITATLLATATLIGVGAATAETFPITLKSPPIFDGKAKIDVFDVNDGPTGKYMFRDKKLDKEIKINAVAKMGGASDPKKLGVHIRWEVKFNKRCWTGQVCSIKKGATQRMQNLMEDSLSKGEGNCATEVVGSQNDCPR